MDSRVSPVTDNPASAKVNFWRSATPSPQNRSKIEIGLLGQKLTILLPHPVISRISGGIKSSIFSRGPSFGSGSDLLSVTGRLKFFWWRSSVALFFRLTRTSSEHFCSFYVSCYFGCISPEKLFLFQKPIQMEIQTYIGNNKLTPRKLRVN